MKKIILVLILSFFISSCMKEVEQDVLVVYSPNSKGLIEAVIPAFEEKTGIKVELYQNSTVELLRKLEKEAENPVADIMFGGEKVYYLPNENLFEKYIGMHDALLLDAYQNREGYASSYALDGNCFVVNTNLIGEIKIESYDDLLNPQLTGKIAMADPSLSSSSFAQLTNILLAKGGYEDSEAWQFVEALLVQTQGNVFSNSSDVYEMVVKGEAIVGLSYEDPCIKLQESGAPVSVIYPSEGTVYLAATSGIVKNAKNMENAKKFIDYIQSPDCQDILGLSTTNRPVIKKPQLSNLMRSLESIAILEEDSEYVSGHWQVILERYSKVYSKYQTQDGDK